MQRQMQPAQNMPNASYTNQSMNFFNESNHEMEQFFGDSADEVMEDQNKKPSANQQKKRRSKKAPQTTPIAGAPGSAPKKASDSDSDSSSSSSSSSYSDFSASSSESEEEGKTAIGTRSTKPIVNDQSSQQAKRRTRANARTNKPTDGEYEDDPQDADYSFAEDQDDDFDMDEEEDSEYDDRIRPLMSAPKRTQKNNAAALRRAANATNRRFTHGVVETSIFADVDQQRKNKAKRNLDQESADDDDDEWAPGAKKSSSARKSSRVTEKKTYDGYFDEDEASSDEKQKKIVPKEQLFEETDEEIIERVVDSRKREDEIEEYLIKWKCWAHIHNTWHLREELKHFKGYKKVENFIKKNQEVERWKETVTAEEIEQFNVMQELEKQMTEKWTKVDRVIATKKSRTAMNLHGISTVDEPERDEYLVKWKYLPYAECTWEFAETIKDFEQEINDFKQREARKGYSYPQIGQEARTNFARENTQPNWLPHQLRDYQLEGINWLHHSWCQYTNVILADEMGLGKTIQTISFLNFLNHERNIPGPYVVVVPLSTLHGWLKEFHKWAPELYVISYIGDSRSRQIIREYEMFHDLDTGKNFKFNVILTTYELILKDHEYLDKIRYSYMAVDEAHRLKNDKSKLYEVLIEFQTAGRLLITGTPLQNTLKELWCLLHFLMPAKFNSVIEFEARYSNLNQQDQISKLHEELAPHILRRLKVDVEKSLPRKIERILRVGLSDLQQQYYRWILTKNFSELNKGGVKQTSLLNIVVELKKTCNHPFLFENARDRAGSNKSPLQQIIEGSGKMILLDKLLTRLKETGHRVLIFSQMVKMLNVLGEYLALRGFQFQRLDGSTSSRQRHQVVDHFNAEGSQDFCFLLSTRAGGLGINLATADTVIIFDSDWNPQNDLQAEARAHRIGQTRTVNIYRLVTSDSVEEKILEAAKQKMILDHLVIQKMDTSGRMVLSNQFKKGGKKSYTNFTKDELEEVLKFGAANLFNSTENGGGAGESAPEVNKSLTEMDIDDILARAETTDKSHVEEQQAGQSGSLMGAFKVANFTVTNNKPTQSWEAIMGEHIRRKGHEEELLPPRRRKRSNIGSYKEGGGGDADYEPDEGGDDGDYSDTESGRRKKRDAYSAFNLKDTRIFMRSFRKFFDPTDVKKILQDSDLKKDEKDAQEFINALIEQSKKVVESEEKDKSILINKVKVNAQEVVSRVEQITALKEKIDTYDDPEKFRTMVTPRSVRAWGNNWDITDDANLLRGVLRHGIGSWDKIRTDPDFHLGKKVADSNSYAGDAKKAKPSQIAKRVDALLVALVAEVKQERDRKNNPDKYKSDDDKKKKSTTPSKKKSSSSSSSKKGTKKRPTITDNELLALCDAHFEPISDTLKQFCEMTDEDDKVPKKDRLVKIKKFLMVIGNFIDQSVRNREHMFSEYLTTEDQVIRVMWSYVHNKANTSGNSQTLQNLYHRLLKKKPEENAEPEPAPAPITPVKEEKTITTPPSRSRNKKVDEDDDEHHSQRPTRGTPEYQAPLSGDRKKRVVNYKEESDDEDEYKPPKKKAKAH
jgi:SNF2 family DNA or RNA helicase